MKGTLPAVYSGGNRVLDALPAQERDTLLRAASRLHLERGVQEALSGSEIGHVDFPVGALISVVVVFESGEMIEAGVIGREGLVSVEYLVAEDALQRTIFCQVAGDVIRVPAADFRRSVGRSGGVLGDIAPRIARARLFSAEQFMACNLTHAIKGRCARWLLMARDRVGSNSFLLTQDLLSLMLGVRRAGVSEAAAELQREGGITYHRGQVTVLDNGLLEGSACECYLVTRDAFDRAFRPPLLLPA